MSLGFELAGFKIAFALEKDQWASETYRVNHPDTHVIGEDITRIVNLGEYFGKYPEKIDGIIGGPPCQGFSLSGPRDPKDPRNSLFMNFMEFVKFFRPKFFIMENVPGILSARTRNRELVKNLIIEEGLRNGYQVRPLQLSASDYGVPQTRTRVFFIGLLNSFKYNLKFLTPQPLSAPPVTIRDALGDLPVIGAGEGHEPMEYPLEPQNNYQAWCRKDATHVMNHIAMKHSDRIVSRFKCIKYGQSLADVPPEHMQRKRGDARRISGKIYSQNNMRPWPDNPSPTIPASFQSNFVHPFYDRNYTAREGARLQSFPDNYIFCGKRTTMSWEKNLSQYQQIGNAVPPLLAKALAESIKHYFQHIAEIQPDNIELNMQYSLL